MLENRRTQKWRRAIYRSEDGNFLDESRWLRRRHHRSYVTLCAFARGDESDSAFMVSRIGIGVKALVHLRRGRKTESDEKSAEQAARDEGAEAAAGLHSDAELAPRGYGSQDVCQ